MKNKKWIKVLVIILIIIGVIGFGLSVYFRNIMKVSEEENRRLRIQGAEEYTVKETKFENYIRKTGNITSFNIQPLNVSDGAKVTDMYVNDGDIVQAKQRLLRISDGYSATYINSPQAGMFFITYNEQGARSYQVYNLDEVGVELYVPERDVVKLSIGQKAVVRIISLDKEVEGYVSFISKLPSNGNFKVQVKIPYSEDIKFGYNTTVRVSIYEKENIITIPYDMLFTTSDERTYVVKKEHLEVLMDHYGELPEEYRTYVEVGDIANEEVEIISGLNVGDIIVR